ncbi:MAG: carboxylesterase family protein [Acidobacteria bacterium]|nr:carboxylesterase family protein [Acidobacteriota bacterium]MBI3422498.1 carboxylesterase family protein [Acidobacteriota bacterium]
MKPTIRNLSAVAALLFAATFTGSVSAQERVKTANGTLEGVAESPGIRSFKGVPFGAPPVGDLRWKPPQPVANWTGVRKADKFGPRCMQRPIFGDMNFRSDGMSEDCLYLNVWTPAKTGREKLPVLVYFFGGGFMAGDGSEPRYDGESMAKKGIVAISISYRLSVFGFFAHPELTKESPHHASGNYALFDQYAALQWVQQNVAAFGGDPKRVTIAGESAGSIAVSAQMASPLSKNLIAGAIGESGSMIGALSAVPLAEGEQSGVKFAAGLGKGDAPSLAALRAISADELLAATAKPGLPRFSPTVDGYFFPKAPAEIFAAGEQARVPLLAGSNTEESGAGGVLVREKPTVENYRKALQRLYNEKADEVFKLYPATNETEVLDAAQALASDRFIAYSTWKWVDLATKTGGKPTYYYLYARPRPAMRAEMGDAQPGLAGGVVRGQQAAANPRPPARGASHSAEIEYAMGNLDGNKVFAWTPDDHKVSKTMQEYFANFIKTGNPNGAGLPNWPKFSAGQRMVIDVNTRAEREAVRTRYEFLDQFYVKK